MTMREIDDIQKLAGVKKKTKAMKVKEWLVTKRKDFYRWTIYVLFVVVATVAPKSKLFKRVNILFHRSCFYN